MVTLLLENGWGARCERLRTRPFHTNAAGAGTISDAGGGENRELRMDNEEKLWIARIYSDSKD